MNAHTHSVTVAAPPAQAFAYLADLKNLPEWATECFQAIEVVDGQYWATTSEGKVLCRVIAHEPTGTIDYLAGPSEDQMARWPARVFELPDGQTLFQFTALQLPGMSDEEFAAQCNDLQKELQNVRHSLEAVHV
jgi:hypothetical protein